MCRCAAVCRVHNHCVFSRRYTLARDNSHNRNSGDQHHPPWCRNGWGIFGAKHNPQNRTHSEFALSPTQASSNHKDTAHTRGYLCCGAFLLVILVVEVSAWWWTIWQDTSTTSLVSFNAKTTTQKNLSCSFKADHFVERHEDDQASLQIAHNQSEVTLSVPIYSADSLYNK